MKIVLSFTLHWNHLLLLLPRYIHTQAAFRSLLLFLVIRSIHLFTVLRQVSLFVRYEPSLLFHVCNADPLSTPLSFFLFSPLFIFASPLFIFILRNRVRAILPALSPALSVVPSFSYWRCVRCCRALSLTLTSRRLCSSLRVWFRTPFPAFFSLSRVPQFVLYPYTLTSSGTVCTTCSPVISFSYNFSLFRFSFFLNSLRLFSSFFLF